MCSITGSRSFRASSGSRSASNSIEPFMSANNTVTCLRSPSRALLEVRIFSARCFGVYDCGDANLGAAAACTSDAPHCPQNLFPGGFEAAQVAQTDSNRAPHSPQNFTPEGFSCWQRGQCIGRSGEFLEFGVSETWIGNGTFQSKVDFLYSVRIS